MKIDGIVREVIITTTDTQYSVDEVIDGVKEVTGVVNDSKGSCLLKSITVLDKEDQKSDLDIYFFNEAPVTTVGADNAAFALADSDLAKVIGKVNIAAADYVSSTNNAVATVTNIQMILQSIKDKRTLHLLVISRGTPDFTAGTDLILKLGLERY